MTIFQHTGDYTKLSAKTLAAYADIPAAVVSDAVGERMTMGGAINPLVQSMRICGQARTADCLPGDNSPIRVALQMAKEGEVIVADAKAYEERGLAPENLSRSLEDSGTVTSVLVPWNTCGAYHSGVLGVGVGEYALYAVFNWLSPIMTLLFAAFRIKIKQLATTTAQ